MQEKLWKVSIVIQSAQDWLVTLKKEQTNMPPDFLNGRDYPHVLEYITELRQERERKYGVTLIGQLERLQKLSIGAEEEGQFSAAINAEKLRSALGGLTIDRRETTHTIDLLSYQEMKSLQDYLTCRKNIHKHLLWMQHIRM